MRHFIISFVTALVCKLRRRTVFFLAVFLSVDYAIAANCSDTQWQCLSSECIAADLFCDGVENCKDGSDEDFHFCANITCPDYTFRCSYGACVDADAPCNGVSDCRDKSDELLPHCSGVVTAPAVHNCTDLEFPCISDAKCLTNELVCDGLADCEDGSDETITQCGNFACPGYAFRCAYGGCVDGDAVCDGRQTCADGSDEFAPQCNQTDPQPTATVTPNVTAVPTIPRNTVCTLPPAPEHGTYTSYNCEQGSDLPQCRAVTGTPVQIGFDLHYSCYDGFTIRGNPEQYCRPGGWYPRDPPTCSDECEPLVSSRLQLLCFRSDSTPIRCDRKMPARSFVRFQCRQATYVKVKEPGYNALNCINGQWDRPFTDDFCQPACGRAVLKFAELFISNGTVASYGSFPWHAGIYEYRNQSDTWSLNCGGSLVSRNLVISAAHCFIRETEDRRLEIRNIAQMKIVMGKLYRVIDHPTDTLRQPFDLAKVITNPDYTGSKDNFAYDIALVILNRPVEYSMAVLPVCLDLGRDNIEEDQLVPGAVGMVAGWGLTEDSTPSEKLLVAHLPFVPRDICLKSSNLYTFLTKDKFCAGDPKSTTNVCKGDSGGGLVFEDKQTRSFYLRGIVSLGEQGCDGSDYALFTKLSKHTEFINKYL